jgi:hypothetical protein
VTKTTPDKISQRKFRYKVFARLILLFFVIAIVFVFAFGVALATCGKN